MPRNQTPALAERNCATELPGPTSGWPGSGWAVVAVPEERGRSWEELTRQSPRLGKNKKKKRGGEKKEKKRIMRGRRCEKGDPVCPHEYCMKSMYRRG